LSTPVELLLGIALRLRPLLDEVAFVGGCATQLLITDPAAPPIRITDDVDVIVELSSYSEYARFSARLRRLGFVEDASEGAPICRWKAGGMKLDVMPTDAKLLGFSNRWYKSALNAAETGCFTDFGMQGRCVREDQCSFARVAFYWRYG